MILLYNQSMNDITYKEIALDLNKTEGTIKNWKRNHPVLLKYVRIGAFANKNDLTIDEIKKLLALKEVFDSLDLYKLKRIISLKEKFPKSSP